MSINQPATINQINIEGIKVEEFIIVKTEMESKYINLEWSSEDIMRWVGFEDGQIAKAIIIKEELDFFLKTNEDRQNFIKEFERQKLYMTKRCLPLKVLELAKQVGSHNHTYNDLLDLEQMDTKYALETLFQEPFNKAKLRVFAETKLTLKQLFELKALNPNHLFLNLTLCI
jgi:hypothetical protein